MTETRYPLATSSWDEAEIEAMQRVIASGRLTMGDEVAAFERAFAELHGSRHAVMVNSGSSANLLMVAALFFRRERPLAPGDEVLVPAVSWATTYYPLAQYGLRLRFVDVDRETLNFDLAALRASVTPQTRLVMAVNLLGNPNDFRGLREALGDADVTLLEDNCESLGAEFGGKLAGTFGAMSSASTYFSHHISTMEGGVVLTDDDELHHILLSLRSHGWTRHLPEENHVTGRKSADPFEESFRFVLPGYNVRPLELAAAAGRSQLRKLPRFLDVRRANGARFVEAFGADPRFLLQREVGRSSWFGFSLIVREESGLTRAPLLEALREAGIECRPIVAGNFTRNPVMRYLDAVGTEHLPNADLVHDRGFFVGNQERDLGDAIAWLRETLRRLP